MKTDSLSVEQVVEDVLTALRSFDAMGAKVVGDGEEPRGCEPRC
ncbi:MAG: hypothetical protein U0794_15745 [Isosphaeraceae bacterium]